MRGSTRRLGWMDLTDHGYGEQSKVLMSMRFIMGTDKISSQYSYRP